MSRNPSAILLRAVLLLSAIPGAVLAVDDVAVDLADFQPEYGLSARRDGDRLVVSWPMGGEFGRLAIDLRPGSPRIEGLGVRSGDAIGPVDVLKGVDPVFFVTVGTRVGESGRPPGMSPFNAFFDAPAKRPFRTFKGELTLKKARVSRFGRTATIALGDFTAGPFSGELRIIVYAGSRLVRVEAVAKTDQNDCAFLYDAGLVAATPSWKSVAWTDTEGRLRREPVDRSDADRAIAVRHRMIVAESEAGSVAALPEPHRFFFARDLTDNLGNAWLGAGHRGLEGRPGFGIRQSESGGGNYAPWYNAPPGTEQHIGIFYLLSRGPAEDAIAEALRYTHGDRYVDLPGHVTFTSHWHMAIAAEAMKEVAQGGPRSTPDFVKMFRDLNVNVAHLAEFHGDGHPDDPGPLRIPEMEAMFAECRRLSDEKLLFLPGEEANAALGSPSRKVRAGHWLYLFPKPVYWTMRHAPNQPFAEEKPGLGTVYHVGDGDDMARLLGLEHGLAWTAHPRIKGSAWTPDAYKNESFFHADSWLGAAWKGMPVDLSRERLGERGLDLLDDMGELGGSQAVARRGRRLQGRPHARIVRPHEHQLSQARPHPPIRRRLAARPRRPPRRPLLRHDRRGPDPRFLGPGSVRGEGRAGVDVPDAVAPGRLRRRPCRLSRPRRPRRFDAVRPAVVDAHAGPRRAQVGPRRGVGRGRRRGIQPAGLAGIALKVGENPTADDAERTQINLILEFLFICVLSASSAVGFF